MTFPSLSDIAMLLLIFFIISTEFLVQRTLPAELPAITPAKEEASENLVTVVVAEDYVYLDEERIRLEQLAPFLSAKLASKAKPQDRAVVLDGRADVSWERVVDAADQVRRAGGVVVMMKVEE